MLTGHFTQPGNILLLLHFQLKENNVSQLQFYYSGHDSLNEAVASIAPTIIQRCGRERDLGTLFFFFSHSLYYFISSIFLCRAMGPPYLNLGYHSFNSCTISDWPEKREESHNRF